MITVITKGLIPPHLKILKSEYFFLIFSSPSLIRSRTISVHEKTSRANDSKPLANLLCCVLKKKNPSRIENLLDCS